MEEKVTDAEIVVKEDVSKENKNNDDKTKYEEVKIDRGPNFFIKNWKYIVIFLFGMVLTIFVISSVGGFSNDVNTSVTVNDNGIGTGINKVYDATV